jgi:uncharacterized short protein YbdD (DUF466 family)
MEKAMTADWSGTVRLRLRRFGLSIRSAYHQVFGIPDYKAYLAHRQCHHPDEPRLSPREFVAWWT